jgi:hypothetical protein
MPRNRFALESRRGQSLIESCLAVVMVCLVFCGLFQICRLFAAKEFLDYSAGRAARARAVGFNDFMVFKCGKVACIPNSGVMTEPAFTNVDVVLRDMVETSTPGGFWDWVLGEAAPTSDQYEIERVRIPEFLASPTYLSAYEILDYEDWDSVVIGVGPVVGPDGIILEGSARQDVPLRVPMHSAFYAADEVELEGRAFLENHYSLYLDDMGW